ncbi:hypothetical protein BGY98DRAFT_229013 [Russula aff. rugulosa BPL654]|nr:hypothetical protein BGY98DRAFT_229013 [Russula aff. rugulosa BPL654]
MEAGTDHEGFKIPSTVPQDILLIHDIIGPLIPTQPLTPPAADPDDSVDSSGESTDSAEEVEANLLVGGKSTSEDVSDSASESSSSSSSDLRARARGKYRKNP